MTALAAVLLLTLSASASAAQENPAHTDSRPGWVRTFNDIKVQEIKPGELPTATVPPGALGAYGRSEKLPKPATQTELRDAAARVSARVVRLVAVQTPPRPYRQVPMLYFGHAVWVAPPKSPASPGAARSSAATDAAQKAAARPAAPVLLSTWDWLESADTIYALTTDISPTDLQHSTQFLSPLGSSAAASQRALKSAPNARDASAWLQEHRHALIPLAPARPDRHRNLVELAVGGDSLPVPQTGLELFDPLGQALFRLYGFSPYAHDSLIEVQIVATAPKNPALAFYWQTNFGAILGAPLVSQDARLVALNALRSPDGEALFLSIPTHAIASYLAQRPANKDEPPPADTPSTTPATPASGEKP